MLTEHSLNTTDYLSIVAEHIHPFMTAVYTSSDVCLPDNSPCHKAQITSYWFLDYHNEFIELHSQISTQQSTSERYGGTGDLHELCYRYCFRNFSILKKTTNTFIFLICFITVYYIIT